MAKSDGASAFKLKFLARVAAARDSQGFTQETMATALGMDQPKYSKYEKRSLMPHYLIEQFCLITHVSEKWLMTGKGPGPVVMPLPAEAKKTRRRRTRQRAA